MNVMKEIEQIYDHRVDANREYDLAGIIFLTIAQCFAVQQVGKQLISTVKPN